MSYHPRPHAWEQDKKPGHAGMWMGGMYDLRTPTQSDMRSAGHLGWAFCAGIGAKAACPQRPDVVTGIAALAPQAVT